jgi:hypothetical protein
MLSRKEISRTRQIDDFPSITSIEGLSMIVITLNKAVRQFLFKLPYADFRDLGASEIDVLKLSQVPEMCQPCVGDLSVLQTKPLELSQSLQFRERGVRNLGFAEAQTPDLGEILQVFQVSVCDITAVEFHEDNSSEEVISEQSEVVISQQGPQPNRFWQLGIANLIIPAVTYFEFIIEVYAHPSCLKGVHRLFLSFRAPHSQGKPTPEAEHDAKENGQYQQSSQAESDPTVFRFGGGQAPHQHQKRDTVHGFVLPVEKVGSTTNDTLSDWSSVRPPIILCPRGWCRQITRAATAAETPR